MLQVDKGVVNGPITGIEKQRAISFRGIRVERVGKLWRPGTIRFRGREQRRRRDEW
jgi:hypothetical protein